MSKMAEGEWCARTDPAAKSTVKTIKIPGILYLKEVLPFTLGEYITQAVRFRLAPMRAVGGGVLGRWFGVVWTLQA